MDYSCRFSLGISQNYGNCCEARTASHCRQPKYWQQVELANEGSGEVVFG